MSKGEQICIVCERDISMQQVASDLGPGDLVVCQDCDRITPNRAQAETHFRKRSLSWLRHIKIEEAAQEIYEYYSGMAKRGLLTNGELLHIEALGKALKMQKSGDPS